MEITAELREQIYSLSPEKLKQLERFVDFLTQEAKQKDTLKENIRTSDKDNDDKQV